MSQQEREEYLRKREEGAEKRRRRKEKMDEAVFEWTKRKLREEKEGT